MNRTRVDVRPIRALLMEDLIARTRICFNCNKTGDTVRVGFAGRVCPACRVELAPELEGPGWTN